MALRLEFSGPATHYLASAQLSDVFPQLAADSLVDDREPE